jgi:anti-sigma factor RsiW
LYTEVGGIAGATVKPTTKHLDNQKDELAGAVDKILASPPPSALDAARKESMRPFQWDVPDILLQLALLAAVGLAACRVGMRL